MDNNKQKTIPTSTEADSSEKKDIIINNENPDYTNFSVADTEYSTIILPSDTYE